MLSNCWEGVRHAYAPFEADIRSGTSDVYNHEMPGGPYTNLREQARATGLAHRWPEISHAYAEVNRLFGDIVKVTPTSKVVGDMAIFMVANELRAEGVADPARDIAFSESVVSLFKGELGFPPEGIPKAGLGDPLRTRRKAEEGNAKHVAAPMPGSVVSVAVKPGQKLAKGAPLLSIEAMKMEAAMTADGDLVVKAVNIKPGDVIAVKDLRVEFA